MSGWWSSASATTATRVNYLNGEREARQLHRLGDRAGAAAPAVEAAQGLLDLVRV
jgi:hypothetical protein